MSHSIHPPPRFFPELRTLEKPLYLQYVGLAPAELESAQLLQQIHTVARVNHFMFEFEYADGALGAPEPNYMRWHYGLLLCDDKLKPLIDEARARTSCKECAAFLVQVDAAIQRSSQQYGNQELAFTSIIPTMYDNALIRPYQKKIEEPPPNKSQLHGRDTIPAVRGRFISQPD